MTQSHFTSLFERQLRQELTDSFQTLDQDHQGYIQFAALRRELGDMGYNPSDIEFRTLSLALAGRDKERVYLEDYLRVMTERLTTATHRKSDLMMLFEKISDCEDKISIQDIERLGYELGEEDPLAVSRQVMREIDRDGDSGISLEEFIRVINKVSDYS